MKISEVAEMTGLDISTVRFYERKGLIKPSRAENSNYRFYTDEDVSRLKQIVLYRKMNLSIETIARLLDEPATLQTVLQTQEEKLISERERVGNALALCKKMIDDQVSEEFDINYYMNYVRTEEEKGKKYPIAVEMLDNFAFNSGMEYPWLSPLLSHNLLRYLIAAAVFLILAVFPAIVVIEKILEWRTGYTGPQQFVFWLICLFIYMGIFIRIMKRR